MLLLAIICLTQGQAGQVLGSQDEVLAGFLAAAGPEMRDLDAYIRSCLVQAGGTPLAFEAGVLFLAQAKWGRPPGLLGDFNAWGADYHSESFQPTEMQAIAGSSWFAHFQPLAQDARVQYLLCWGEEQAPDPCNLRHYDSGKALYSEAFMPGYRSPGIDPDPLREIPRGQVLQMSIDSKAMGGPRTFFIYTPAGYAQGGPGLPLALFADGGHYLETGCVDLVFDQLIAERRVPPLVAVLVPPLDRASEYSGDSRYRAFVVDEILPLVSARFRLVDNPAYRALFGSSRGGMAAYDLALQRPDVFAFCASFSPAFYPADPLGLFPSHSVFPPARFWTLVADYDFHWRDEGLTMDRLLREHGYHSQLLRVAEGHNLKTWLHRLELPLRIWLGDPLHP